MTSISMMPLEELMATRLGSIDPSRFVGETFELYSIPAFESLKPEIVTGAQIGSTKQLVQPSDVLLSKIVPHIRRSWIVNSATSLRQIASGEWIVFRSDRAVPEYLRHVLLGDEFHRQFMQTVSGVGGSLLRARPSQVAKIQIPLPSLQEQRRIAAILDKVDALRIKRREALAQLDRLAQSIFVALFYKPQFQDWPVRTVADIVVQENGGIRTGPFGSQLLHSEFIDSGVAVLGIDNVVANEFRWGERRYITEAKYIELKRYTVKPGDVLITIMGTCGRCAVVPDDIPVAINTKHLCCITLNQGLCIPDFLRAYFLWHPMAREYLERTGKGAIMTGLNMGLIKAMPIPLPPLSLQEKFVTSLKAVESVKATQRHTLARLEKLFASLQNLAFQGDL